MPPAFKVRRGHLVFGSSVCLSVRPSVRLSVRLSVRPKFRPAYKQSAIFKVWGSYSNQTWTVASSKDYSPFTDIKCPRGWGGVKM